MTNAAQNSGTEAQQDAVASEFDDYSNHYSGAVNDALVVPGLKVDYFTKVKAKYLAEQVKRHFGDTNSRSVLDLGCGVGNYHSLLKPHFGRLVGIDVSEKSVERAKSINEGVEYFCYPGGELPFSDNEFDVAYAICVVHHVPVDDWLLFFREMKRVLKPGGLGMIFEHNPKNPLTMRVVNNCPFDADAVLLNLKTCKGLFEKAGFDEIKARHILSIPTIDPITRKFDLELGRMPFGAQYMAVASKS